MAQTEAMGWTARPAVLDDAPRLGEITVAGWRHAYRGVIGDDRLAALDAQEFAERRRETIATPEPTAVYVAQRDGEGSVEGYIVVGPPRRPDLAGDGGVPTGELATLYLDPRSIGTGAGTLLHDVGIAHLAAAGFERAVLWAFVGNDVALAFYARRGWYADGDPWWGEGWSAPAVRWARSL